VSRAVNQSSGLLFRRNIFRTLLGFVRETLNQHQRRLVKESSVRRKESIEEEFGQGKALSQVHPSFGGGQNF
jgi:hypothetical protein